MPPHISATKFLAFGDSITEGKTATSSVRLVLVGCPGIDQPTSYVDLLRVLLPQRYTTQSFDVVNCGQGGEPVVGGGAVRLPSALAMNAPQVLLLFEGANDLIGPDPNPQAIVNGLRDMVQTARRGGVVVFIATLLPQRPGGTPARATVASALLIPQTNDLIRPMAASEGAIPVDLWQAFGGSPDPWIDVDGLHPTVAGHQKIAETFFAVIRSRLEVPTTTVTTRWW